MSQPGMPHGVKQGEAGVSRVYVTCVHGEGCPRYELYDGDDLKAGHKAGADHVKKTGHTVCVDVERTHFLEAR